MRGAIFMGGRIQTTMIVALWLLAMGWLTVYKLIPPLLVGNPPTYVDELPQADAQPPLPVVWRLRWNDRAMGYAVRHAVRTEEGGELRSVIMLDSLPVQQLLAELFGPLARLSPFDPASEIDMVIANRMQIDAEGSLRSLDTVIDIDQIRRCIELQGRVDASKTLQLDASVGMSQKGPRQTISRQSIKLPPGGELGDSLSPRSEMHNLEIGQRWTIPVYRPFSPGNPTEIVEAKVVRIDFLSLSRAKKETIETYRVEYRSEAGAGISASSDPIGIMWVTGDGEVIQQEVMLSNLRLLFVRLDPSEDDQGQSLLVNDENFAAYFSPGDAAPRSDAPDKTMNPSLETAP